MVISLLIPAIPTTIGTCEAISVQKQKILEAKLCAKFNLVAHVRDKGAIDQRKLSELDGSHVVLFNGKVRLKLSPSLTNGQCKYPDNFL